MLFDRIVLAPFDALRVSLFPKKCMGCGEVIDEDRELCVTCEKNLIPIDHKKRCKFCGIEREFCTCKARVYYFKYVIGIYENDGIAKHILYKYKLSKNCHYAEFIADKMAEGIKTEFHRIKFDAVISVPTSPHSTLSRGFDHSKLLAEIIADKLNVRYRNDIIKCKFFKKSQHKSKYKERFANMKDKYYVNHKCKYDNVLLVDDIKTTGASLDACAKQLLLSGAKNVYCVTFLESVHKKSKLHNK